MNTRPSLGRARLAALFLASSCLLLAISCSKPPEASSGLIKLKVAYLGLTCEAPIFMAQEKGFYKEEGLDVELIRTDWKGLREGLNSGNFDANHTLIMYLLQPIAEGLDVRITGGIHTGCLRVLAGVDSDIKKVSDLAGKRIGVPTHLYSPPHMFATRVLSANNIDPKKGVEWVVLQADQLLKAMENKQIDALATTDPIGTILIEAGQVRVVADQAKDPPYKDEYCCAVVVSGQLAEKNPAAAAKVTRALLKGAKWVETNPAVAARLSIEKKFIGSNADVNAHAIAKLRYVPGVKQCEESVRQAVRDMKKAGLLQTKIDNEELVRRAWLNLDGVTDEWLKGLQVERVAGGNTLPPMTRAEWTALLGGKQVAMTCCCVK